jgi:hypothetical protein
MREARCRDPSFPIRPKDPRRNKLAFLPAVAGATNVFGLPSSIIRQGTEMSSVLHPSCMTLLNNSPERRDRAEEDMAGSRPLRSCQVYACQPPGQTQEVALPGDERAAVQRSVAATCRIQRFGYHHKRRRDGMQLETEHVEGRECMRCTVNSGHVRFKQPAPFC